MEAACSCALLLCLPLVSEPFYIDARNGAAAAAAAAVGIVYRRRSLLFQQTTLSEQQPASEWCDQLRRLLLHGAYRLRAQNSLFSLNEQTGHWERLLQEERVSKSFVVVVVTTESRLVAV